MLLTAEAMPTAGGPGETSLQGQMSVVVTWGFMPGSEAHHAQATRPPSNEAWERECQVMGTRR